MKAKLTSTLLPVVVNAINEYGITVNVYRDIYENVDGVKTKTSNENIICTLRCVIDNSNSSNNINNIYKNETLIKPVQTVVIYWAYDSKINLQLHDYIIVEGIRYTLDVPQNVLHYDVLMMCNAEVTIDGRF